MVDAVHATGEPGGQYTLPSGATVCLFRGDTGYIWEFTRPDGPDKPPVVTHLALSFEAMAAVIMLGHLESEHIQQALAATALSVAGDEKEAGR